MENYVEDLDMFVDIIKDIIILCRAGAGNLGHF